MFWVWVLGLGPRPSWATPGLPPGCAGLWGLIDRHTMAGSAAIGLSLRRPRWREPCPTFSIWFSAGWEAGRLGRGARRWAARLPGQSTWRRLRHGCQACPSMGEGPEVELGFRVGSRVEGSRSPYTGPSTHNHHMLYKN